MELEAQLINSICWMLEKIMPNQLKPGAHRRHKSMTAPNSGSKKKLRRNRRSGGEGQHPVHASIH